MLRSSIIVNPNSHLMRLKTIKSCELRSLSTKHNNSIRDSVSATHPISNLRLIKFAKHPNESIAERDFRIKRIKLQNWNHNYWFINNSAFQKEKSEFIKNELKGSNTEELFKPTLSYDELAVFYKRFLDANHRKHMNYNFEWYKRHVSLLWPAFIVFLTRLKRRLF